MEFDHQQAIRSRAVERYLLDELPSPLREGFEDHFFCCAQCAEALRVGSILRDNARALLRAPQTDAAAPVERRDLHWAADPSPVADPALPERSQDQEMKSLGWRTWLRLPVLLPWAAALFLFVALVQQRQHTAPAGLSEGSLVARSAVSVTLLTDVRGGGAGDPAQPQLPPDSIVFLSIDVTADGAYDWAIRSALAATTAPALHQGSGQALHGVLAVSVDTSRLKPGNYTITVRQAGLPASADRIYPFQVASAR